MSSLPDPLSYLSQALQPNTPAPPQDASQAPPMAPPAANQGDQTTQPPQPAGRLRGLLSNFFQGAGAAMSHEVGLPTPYDKQQQAIQVGLQQQQAASIEGLRQAQAQAQQANSQLIPFQLPDGQSVMIPAGHAQTLAAALARTQGGMATSQLSNATKEAVAQISANARTGSAQTAADSRETVANIGAGSRESVAKTSAAARVGAAQIGAGARTTAAGISAAGKTTASGQKITADEQRRADLATNLNENLGALEDIATRRPELFGPVQGRITGLKIAAGTSDPDVAKLETIKHQIGMAQISAHGMRSAHGIEGAASSILNNFYNSPDAIKGSIGAARDSVKTFLNTPPTVGGSPIASPTTPAPSADFFSQFGGTKR